MNALAGKAVTRQLDEQRHMDRGVIKENAVSQFPMLTQRLAVVGCYDDERIVVQPLAPQIIQELAYDIVHVGDCSVIRLFGILAAERFRRIVGVVCIPEVKPQEKRAPLLLAHPFERMSEGYFAAPLHRSFATFAGFLAMKARVVDIKAALEPRGKSVFGIENDAAYKCSSM